MNSHLGWDSKRGLGLNLCHLDSIIIGLHSYYRGCTGCWRGHNSRHGHGVEPCPEVWGRSGGGSNRRVGIDCSLSCEPQRQIGCCKLRQMLKVEMYTSWPTFIPDSVSPESSKPGVHACLRPVSGDDVPIIGQTRVIYPWSREQPPASNKPICFYHLSD